jgi:multiple sugar transport system permease protein
MVTTMSGQRRRGGRHDVLRRREALTGVAFAGPSVLVLAALIVVPVLVGVRLSLHDSGSLARLGDWAGLANYARIATDPALGRILVNTAVWTIGSLIGQLGVGLAAAVLINGRHKLMPAIRVVLLMPYILPVIAQVLTWRWMLDGRYGFIASLGQSLGILGPSQGPLSQGDFAMATVIVMNVWRGFPFAMLVYWASLQTIDQSQVEAAQVDGASAWQVFRHITLPHLREATMTLIVLRGIWTLMYFDLIWLSTGGGPVNATGILPTYIYEQALGRFNVGYAAALATGAALVLLVVVAGYFLIRAWRARPARAPATPRGLP